MIPPAQATGRFTLIPNAMAREIIVGKDGKAQAVSYIDKATRRKCGCTQSVCVGSERLRNCALAAQFAFHAVSQWAGEFVRGGRPLSDGFRGQHVTDISRNWRGGSAQP